MIVELSDALLEKVKEGLDGNESCVFLPEVILHNPNTGFEANIELIEGFAIVCDYMTAYCNTYQLNFKVDPITYVNILKNMKDLEVSISLFPYNPIYLDECYDQDPLTFELKVLVDEQTDLEKVMNINILGDTTKTNDGENTPLNVIQAQATMDMQLTMLEPEIFELRHIQINAMFNGCTVESLLYWIAQQFKAEQVNVTVPDNPTPIDNLIIPPTQDISTIFNFIQERYGIFKDGLGYYFENKIMYIYPLFAHDRDRSTEDGIIHLISAPDDYFVGLDRFHCRQDPDVLVVSTTKKSQQAVTSKGVENEGNTHMSTNADEARDKFVQVQENGDVKMTGNPVTTVAMTNNASNMQGDAQNVKFCGERVNLYASTEKFAELNGSTYTCGWSNAYPGLIKPGHICTLHYDGTQGEYKTQNGTILSVNYSGTTNTSSEGRKPWITFKALIGAHLEPDRSGEDQFQTIQV